MTIEHSWNDEARMTNDESRTNDETRTLPMTRGSAFGFRHSFVIRRSVFVICPRLSGAGGRRSTPRIRACFRTHGFWVTPAPKARQRSAWGVSPRYQGPMEGRSPERGDRTAFCRPVRGSDRRTASYSWGLRPRLHSAAPSALVVWPSLEPRPDLSPSFEPCRIPQSEVRSPQLPWPGIALLPTERTGSTG